MNSLLGMDEKEASPVKNFSSLSMRSPILHFLGFWLLAGISLFFLYQYHGEGSLAHVVLHTLPLLFLFFQSLLLKRRFLLRAALFLTLFLPYLYFHHPQDHFYVIAVTEFLFALFAISRINIRQSKAAPLIFVLAVLIALYFYSFSVLPKSYANYALYGGGGLLLLITLLVYPFDRSFFVGAMGLFALFLLQLFEKKELILSQWRPFLFFLLLYGGYYFVSYPDFRMTIRR